MSSQHCVSFVHSWCFRWHGWQTKSRQYFPSGHFFLSEHSTSNTTTLRGGCLSTSWIRDWNKYGIWKKLSRTENFHLELIFRLSAVGEILQWFIFTVGSHFRGYVEEPSLWYYFLCLLCSGRFGEFPVCSILLISLELLVQFKTKISKLLTNKIAGKAFHRVVLNHEKRYLHVYISVCVCVRACVNGWVWVFVNMYVNFFMCVGLQ